MSRHAQRRSQQRGIPKEGIEAALDWGQVIVQKSGRRAYFVGRRQVSEARRQGVEIRVYERTAVIVAPDGTIVTAVRAKRPDRLRKWRRRRG